LKQQTLFIDDSWVLSRARGYSKSFREFLLGIAPQLAEKDRKEVEKAAEILGPKGMDQLEMPAWIKPFATKITQQVSQKITAELPKIAAQLFRAGIFSLSNALYDVAKERGVRNESVLRLIKMLPEFETLMYFLNVRKYYRDHCAHQLRVAVLGDFLLDLKSQAGSMESIIKEKLCLSSTDVRTAWWFAGLLHDTGIPLAKLCTAINYSILNEIFRCYSFLDIKASPILVSLTDIGLRNEEYFSILVDGMPERWKRIVENGLGTSDTRNEPVFFRAGQPENREYQPEDPHMDHGVVGAINLLKTLGKPQEIRKNQEYRPLVEAARAIALHNFKSELKDLPFEDSPLAFLLVLADELQEWSRPVPVPVKDTYFTTSLEKVALLDSISYRNSEEFWEIPYTNTQAKKVANFDFKMVCKDKASSLKTLNCAEQFPETEILLKDVNPERKPKEEKFEIVLRTE
jgi:hypothetical protein